MMDEDVNLDSLFLLAEATPMFGEVENLLSRLGKLELRQKLIKLQQDAGVAINHEMNGVPVVNDRDSQAFWLESNYDKVTWQRLELLRYCLKELPEAFPHRASFQGLMECLGVSNIECGNSQSPNL